jgi:hypothetical protein
MKANLLAAALVCVSLMPSVNAWAQGGAAQPPIIAKALIDGDFKAKVTSDAQQATIVPKGSEAHTKFLQTYFPKGKASVDSVAAYFKKFCIPGVGEGCGIAQNMLGGAHYNGCIGGVGEGCGKSKKGNE